MRIAVRVSDQGLIPCKPVRQWAIDMGGGTCCSSYWRCWAELPRGRGHQPAAVVKYERGIVFRFGRLLDQVRGPGLAMIVPVADRLHKVNMQIVTMPVPAQEGITRDNVTVRVTRSSTSA